ncbi:MAG: hypothetical protein RMK30_04345 [Anaerolineae bacterium]|nr:hypothetical protein [Anaerolineae bacterium]MDW8102091.1 hypothetical protein [Anaerolineae bacterium]
MGQEIGRVIHANTTQFTAGCRTLLHDIPSFGDFVKVLTQDGSIVYGFIYNVSIQSDSSVRQLITAQNLPEEYIRDHIENRLLPVEISVVVVGYKRYGFIRQEMPPQPPMPFSVVESCSDEEVREFALSGLDFLRTILSNPGIPADDLIAVGIRRMAGSLGKEGRYFLVDVGRELTRLLYKDTTRLESLLRRIRP